MVDLANRGVLRQQHPVAATKVGDVTGEHDDARDLVTVEEWDRTDEERHLAVFDLLGDGAV